jgi:hypothetical protein
MLLDAKEMKHMRGILERGMEKAKRKLAEMNENETSTHIVGYYRR